MTEPLPGPAPTSPPGRSAGRWTMLFSVLFLGLILVRLWWPGTGADTDRGRHLRGEAFGTYFAITVLEPTIDDHTLAEHVDHELRRLDALYSTFNDQAELAQINAAPHTDPIPVSDELAQVLGAALDIARASDGAFDPTVGPLVRLWGFGRDGRRREAPDAETLAAAQAVVGHHLLVLEDGHLSKTHPDLQIDLAAIAKGEAVDRLSALLHTLGMPRHLVDIGGDLRVSGPGPRGQPWVIGVQLPEAGAAPQVVRTLHLESAAVATSGDYRNFQDLADQRVSHIIDPHTGRPVRDAPASVTVIADSCREADAWATAFSVMGTAAALASAEEHAIAVLLLTRAEDGTWQHRASSAFIARDPP